MKLVNCSDYIEMQGQKKNIKISKYYTMLL